MVGEFCTGGEQMTRWTNALCNAKTPRCHGYWKSSEYGITSQQIFYKSSERNPWSDWFITI
jgi:hypothetical protein